LHIVRITKQEWLRALFTSTTNLKASELAKLSVR
jgi:hypothetical protein